MEERYKKFENYNKQLKAFKFYYYAGIVMLVLSVIGSVLACRSEDSVLIFLMFSLSAIFCIGTVSGKKKYQRNHRL